MTTPATLRVVLAEDHYLVREGTRRLLESTGEISVVAAVGTAGELFDAARRFRPDVVVTDIRMPSPADPVRPGMEGVDAAHRIRSAARELGVIGVVVLSQFSDAVFALDLFRDGTEGRAYLLKDRVGDIDELLGAIRSVAAGGSVIDPKVVEGLLAKRGVRGGPPPAELTPRELDVLREMAHGLSNGGIARTLHLSVSAIEKHVNAIFMKLALENSPDTHRRVAAVIAYLGSG
ncbi:LuxR C-terminal-related transcriptional regulator [Planomonospora algeriensis]